MAQDPSPPPATEVYRAWVAVHQAALLLQAAVAAQLRAQRLDWPRAALLAVLRAHGPQRITTLAHYLLSQTTTMTDLIDRLERAGLAQRSRDATDRRVVLVALTAAGEAAAVGVDAALAEVATAVFGTAQADIPQLTALLRRVRDVSALTAGIPSEHFAVAAETLTLPQDPAA
jgi:DNA-binding MarR family transcriptional regulator